MSKEKNIFDFFALLKNFERLVYIEGQFESLFTVDQIDTDVISKLDTYLKKTCANELVDTHRKNNRDDRLDISLFDDVSEQPMNDEWIKRVEKVNVRVMGYTMQLDAELADSLDRLPDKHRATFVLNTVAKIPMKAIAELLGISLRTATYYKKQAKEQLRKELDNYEER